MIGITEGSKLEIYSNNLSVSSNLPLGTLLVDKDNVKPFKTILSTSGFLFDIPKLFFAKTTFPLAIYAEEKFRDEIRSILSTFHPLEREAIHLHDHPSDANVQLKIERGKLVFYRCSDNDQEFIKLTGGRILQPATTDSGSIFNALKITSRTLLFASFCKKSWIPSKIASASGSSSSSYISST